MLKADNKTGGIKTPTTKGKNEHFTTTKTKNLYNKD